MVLNRVLLGHLQTLLSVLLVRLQLFGLPLGKLGLYLGRVDVGVEIGHDGEDDAHQHQQRGEEDVLGPLVDEKKMTVFILEVTFGTFTFKFSSQKYTEETELIEFHISAWTFYHTE